MKRTPPDWPRISTALYYDDASKAIDWLCKAFGFEVQMKVQGDGGRIEHSELVYGGGLIMVSEASASEKFPYRRSPSQIDGANTQNMFVYVDDVDAHCKHAGQAGAKITMAPETVDGADHWSDRHYECQDLGGHHWWFAQRMRDAKKT